MGDPLNDARTPSVLFLPVYDTAADFPLEAKHLVIHGNCCLELSGPDPMLEIRDEALVLGDPDLTVSRFG
jgi:hypothetical protein